MKPSRYMLSVQWGSGHHYFLGQTFDKKSEALNARLNHRSRLASQTKDKRGAKPTVYLWEKLV